MRHPVGRIFVATLLIGFAYWMTVTFTGSEASFGETNFQNNMIRVDALLNEPPGKVVLVGSSISGRLLPGYFPSGDTRVVNFGLDGCTLLTGLEFIRQMKKTPEVLLLECMRTNFEPQANDAATLKIIDSPMFMISRWLPVLRPSWRPSSVLYTETKLSRENAVTDPANSDSGARLGPQLVISSSGDRAESDPWKAKTIDAIDTFTYGGVRCISVRIPTNIESLKSESRPRDLGDDLDQTIGIPVIDTISVIRERGLDIAFTDGLHLRSDSARLISEIIWEALLDIDRTGNSP